MPGTISSLTITDPALISTIRTSLDSESHVYLAAFSSTSPTPTSSDPSNAVPFSGPSSHLVGSMLQVHSVPGGAQMIEGGDGIEGGGNMVEELTLLVICHRRITLIEPNREENRKVKIEHWGENAYDSTLCPDPELISALTTELTSQVRGMTVNSPNLRDSLSSFFKTSSTNDEVDVLKLCDYVVGMLGSASAGDIQSVLETREPKERAELVLKMVSEEVRGMEIRQGIKERIEEQLGESNRKFVLREMIKEIQSELGEGGDGKDEYVVKGREEVERLRGAGLGEEVRKALEGELDKIESLSPSSSEYNVSKSYIDTLLALPWGLRTKEVFDLSHAEAVLEREHYGMDDVKSAILEFIAVGKLKERREGGGVKGTGKIICLAGPPGVGKTSIGKSIAESLGREFYRFSVGGLSDVSEIKGHRRTYVGAMPGKLIQCLKTTKTSNPLILIDEIDKLSQSGSHGDPASALLELLDPSQNGSFRDHYLDVPFDMSDVLFMCTANQLEYISPPLLDRMEVIQLSGYDVPEKVEIANRYLVPKAMSEAGLGEGEGEIKEDAVEALVRWYCREAGVRNLEKHVRKISRKIALHKVALEEGVNLQEKDRKKHEGWSVDSSNLSAYVGKPIFTSDRMYDVPPHGVVMGLAYTSMGGSALYIESQKVIKGTEKLGEGGGIKVTGQLGDVMKESVQIAHTNARRILNAYQSGNSFFDDHDIHLHVPEGATPKDGPSAGITVVTSLLSLALDRPCRDDVAMTGEISLTGKVLPIGGVKEKAVAARRAGITCLILPEENRRHWDELPEYLKEGMEVHFAEEYSKVFEVAFMEEDFYTTGY